MGCNQSVPEDETHPTGEAGEGLREHSDRSPADLDSGISEMSSKNDEQRPLKAMEDSWKKNTYGSKHTKSFKRMNEEGVNLQTEFSDRVQLNTDIVAALEATLSSKYRSAPDDFPRVESEGAAPRLETIGRTRSAKCLHPRYLPTDASPDPKRHSYANVDVSMLTWDLKPHEQSSDWMVDAILAMFVSSGVVRKFELELDALTHFILTVRHNYDDQPFHNFTHAFSVTHASWMMVQAEDVGCCLTDVDKLSILVAAVCHDLGHPGVNNDFLAKTDDILARTYAPPILENHHWALAKTILEAPNVGGRMLAALSDSVRQDLFTFVHEAIMATDMSVHKNITEKLDEKLAVKAQNREMSVFSLDSAADRLFLVGLLVHAADLSGQGMCRETAYFFGHGVLREFHAQYDRECAQGLPLSTFMQGLETHLGQAKAQLGFLSFVVAPMWRQLALAFDSINQVAERVEERTLEIDFDCLGDWGGKLDLP